MREIYSNISIIGGGLIGSLAALSSSNLGYSVSLVDKNSFKKANNTERDMRTVAISEGSKQFLDKINVWKEISKFSEPIKKIKIIDRSLSNLIDFNNFRRGSNLGYIVKNQKLLEIILNQLKKRKNINIFDNTKILGVENSNEKSTIISDKYKIFSNLNIAADGKNSFVRNFLKTKSFIKKYSKNAMVCTFSHSKSHNNTAYEFFYNEGPLAILPMQKEKDRNLSSIVWTSDVDYLNKIFNFKEKNLLPILEKMTMNSVGEITKVYNKQLFPLSAHINSKFYEKRTIYIGDSAHSVHPIAGQGWNLGVKDIESLCNILSKYKSLGIEPGSNFFCKEYHNDTFYKAYRLYQITDKLDFIFKTNNLPLYFGRVAGSKLIQNSSKIKNIISDFAMGF